MRTWLDTIRSGEPARWAELARAILAALVAGGWLVLDDRILEWALTGLGLLGSVGLTAFVRNAVYSRNTVLARPAGIATVPRDAPVPVQAPDYPGEPATPEPPPAQP